MSFELLYVATTIKSDGQTEIWGELGIECLRGAWSSVLRINGQPYASKDATSRADALAEVHKMRIAADERFAAHSLPALRVCRFRQAT